MCFHPLQMGLACRRKLSKHDAGSKPASIIATSVSSSSSSLTSLDAKMNLSPKDAIVLVLITAMETQIVQGADKESMK